MTKTEGSLKILAIAVNELILKYVRSLTSDLDVEFINSEDEFDEKFDSFSDGQFSFIICGSELGTNFSSELAQVLNCQCPSTPSFYVTDTKENFKARELEKNGFTKAFLYPPDKERLKSAIISSVDAEALKERHFKSVRIIDFEENDTLDFETYVFLPLNKKYVRFSAAGENFSNKKIEKLNKHYIGSVHIDHKDANTFYEYSAQRLKKLNQDGSMSATEKEEKLQESISGLFTEMFDSSVKDSFDRGKGLLSTSQKIVSNYITGGLNNNWYANLIRTIGASSGTYPHATEVSTYAALFAIGLQHPSPDDLALAGFMHDLSLAELPEEILDTPLEEWSEEHLKIYNEHPKNSLNIIKNKKMIINPKIERAILDHHEMFNGKGFPKQKSGDMISDEAQILSFADQFQYLISVKEGQKRLSPLEAYKQIEKTGSINPQLLKKIKGLLIPPKEE